MGPAVDCCLRALEAARMGRFGQPAPPAQVQPDAHVTALAEEVSSLKASLHALLARSGETSFEIAGIPFRSHRDMETWVTTEHAEAYPFYFLDPVSLLQLMETGSKDANAMVKAAYEGERVNLSGDIEVGVAYSYLVEVPTILGGSLDAVRKYPKSLDRVKEFSDFETEGSYDTGLRKRIKTDLKNHQSSIKTMLESAGLSGKAQRVAIHMLDESVLFIKKMLSWMSDQHRGYGIGSGISDSAKWELVCLLVRIIFRDMRRVRRHVQHVKLSEAKSVRFAHHFVWAAVQAHRVAANYVDKDFNLHPSIAPILTSHLLDVCAFKDELVSLHMEVESKIEVARGVAKEAATMAKAARTQADRAVATASPGKQKTAKKEGANEEKGEKK